MDRFEQLFTESLRLAGEENPSLAREAIAIAIWYLRTNKKDVGFQHWHSRLEKEMKASLDLLRTLLEEEYHHSPKPLQSTHAKDRFIQQLFIISLKLAGIIGYPVVAKEAATIALHFLTENDDVCWKCWRYTDEWKNHSLKLPSSPTDAVILSRTMKSFSHRVMPLTRVTSLLISSLTLTCALFSRNKKGITERGEKASLYKEAHKFCKVISRKLTHGSITVVVLVTAVTTAAFVLLYLSVFGYLK
ncbi:hypothetical protein F2Q68_00024348 [Brassica cretica]|uniref:Uncharacterized protein n=1 Tax=Brassica cretica TaxID=69181 RepID=A0A8S9IBP1_BRACR|nr:hypothetical protein F2Q68_00024348 [Brassica cretica]